MDHSWLLDSLLQVGSPASAPDVSLLHVPGPWAPGRMPRKSSTRLYSRLRRRSVLQRRGSRRSGSKKPKPARKRRSLAFLAEPRCDLKWTLVSHQQNHVVDDNILWGSCPTALFTAQMILEQNRKNRGMYSQQLESRFFPPALGKADGSMKQPN